MAQNTYCYSKREEKEHREETPDQSKIGNSAGQTPNSVTSCLMSKHSSDLQPLSALLTTTHVFLLSWFHSQLAAFLGRSPTTLAFPTSWVLQGGPGSTFTASHRASLDLHAGTLLTQPGYGGNSTHCSFLGFLTLRPEPCG